LSGYGPEAACSPHLSQGLANASTILSIRFFRRRHQQCGHWIAVIAENKDRTIMRTFQDAKAMAVAMRDALAEKNFAVSHSEALEIVARQFGLANWNILSSKIDDTKKPGESAISFEQAIPIVRIFDVAKAHEFYLGFLGFKVDWEHRFGETSPLYTQISRGELKLHLSEHSGDASPGGNMVVNLRGVRALHGELIKKNYRYMRPGLEDVEWGLEVTVIDPFGNRIRFIERKE
jgi:hypothetical protein